MHERGVAGVSGTPYPSWMLQKSVWPLLISVLLGGMMPGIAEIPVETLRAGATIKSGVLEVKAGGRIFKMINGREVTLTVLPTGHVKLNFPASLPSRTGKSQTKPWVLNSFMTPLSASEQEALATTGIQLPEGTHTFYVYYIDPAKATTVAQLRGKWWEVMMNPETYRNFTAQSEYVMLEVRDSVPRNTSPDVVEVQLPRELETVTWYPQYQETDLRLNLPPGKKFGVSKRVAGIPAERLVGQGTYLQSVYADVNNNRIPWDKTWSTLRAYPKGEIHLPFKGTLSPGQTVSVDKTGLNCVPGDLLSFHQSFTGGLPKDVTATWSIPEKGIVRIDLLNRRKEPVTLEGEFTGKYFGSLEEEAEKLYHGWARRGNITAAEICENGILFEDVERIFRRIYELQVQRDGVKSPDDSSIIGDYFAHLNGYGTGLDWRLGAADQRALFQTSEDARKSKPGEKATAYYTKKAYEYRHRLAAGYLDSIARLLDGVRLYNHIANLEKQYIAMEDRRVGTFGWTALEGVESLVERSGVWQRLPLEGGDLLRVARPECSFEQLKYETFFSLLIGDYYVSWNDNAPYGTDIRNFGLAHIGGPSPSKNQWQAIGATQPVQYDPANPAHPKAAGKGPTWSDGAAPGHNGGFAGAWLLSRIADRIDKSLRYPAFSYSVDGRESPGYFDGDQPVKGTSGTAEVSRFGHGNPGQCNIVNQQEHRKPIVIYGKGTGGACLIVLNPYAGLTQTTTYQLKEGKVPAVRHVGASLGVYLLNGP